ncbi:MAG: sigma 54-interacting transcriptional regulator [Proteobacteria bacterium]|nr:sigma 54-interacting transcriptional regulator [Pseudomonadota bacterium]
MTQRVLHTQQIVSGDRVVSLRRHPLRIEVIKGPDRKKKAELGRDRIVIGSHERCDFALSDPTVSRQHCEIVLVERGYQVRDLDSTNGTYIDRARIGVITVDQDARLRLGDTVVRIVPASHTVQVDLSDRTQFGPLLGRSPSMRRIFDVLSRVAPTDATVLITGESGTGKEVAARAIHEASGRADGPFVVVDCGALPSNLIESELYGHLRGAFTGALRDRRGAFEAASGGTLFLDEIGELPLDMQTRLLGALERRQVQPLGSARVVSVDVRVVAATNRDLLSEINRGGFREDLYFRLAVVTVHMPALRERPEDIPLYIQEFLSEWSRAASSTLSLDQATMEKLSRQSWRGNVRELRNVLERATALGEVDLDPAATPMRAQSSPARAGSDRANPVDRPTALPPDNSSAGRAVPEGADRGVDIAIPFKVGKQALIDTYERAYIAQLMQAHQNNITRAARAAEIDRVYLLRLLDKFGMRPTRRRS